MEVQKKQWNWCRVDEFDGHNSKPQMQRSWSETLGTPLNKASSESAPVYGVPTSTQGPEYFAGTPQDGTKTLMIVMVGLPARGKTFLAQKLCRLLGWHGITSQTLNVQVGWKQKLKEHLNVEGNTPVVASASAFEEIYTPGTPMRSLYSGVLDIFAEEAKNFFSQGGVVVVLNDDFISNDLREEVEKKFGSLASSTIFVEVQRSSSANSKFDALKANDPEEYPQSAAHIGGAEGVASVSQTAANDFFQRVQFLERHYETMKPDGGRSYIKINNDVLEAHRVQGFLGGRIVSILMNLSQFKIQHPIYFARHGQSMYNLEDRLGGDPVLTQKGELDALSLKELVKSLKSEECAQADGSDSMQLWTSQLKRAIQTAHPSCEECGIKVLRWSSLNEIHAGVCENLTYKEVEEQYPLISRFRSENKYTFRYPQGESYQDLVMRLEPVIMELENANRVVVVVAHQAVLRGLLAYFGSTSAESCVNVEVPHRTVWRCTYNSKGIATIDMLKLGAPATGDGCKD
jgi:broad specificity phosphatase PhoE/predicted kinase